MTKKILISLILCLIAFSSNAFASDNGIIYSANNSTDHGFRMTDIYFDQSDYLTFKFTLLNTSDKEYSYISYRPTGTPNWARPDISFTNCQNCSMDQGGSNSIGFYGFICDNSTPQYYSWAGDNMYRIGKGETITCKTKGWRTTASHGNLPDYLKKSDIIAMGYDIEVTQKWLTTIYANFGSFYASGESYYGFQNSTDHSFPFTSISDGTCGSADNNIPTTIPIPDGDACLSGSVGNMHSYYSFDGEIFAWNCSGSGGGFSVVCQTLPIPDAIDGTCGSADNTIIYADPDESQKCITGATNSTTTIILTGWQWTCEGLYGGNDAICSAIYGGGGSPPDIPDVSIIPTPTDCNSLSGIDQIICNLGNTIQGIFLPSTEKLTELQATISGVANVFPFNYLRVIGNTFSQSTVTQGTLTMTIWGNTETINPAFWDLPIFPKIRLFATILILLMFTFWAIGYVKHFFK
jgi:hypothetical protein